jgi:hypothetical protein
MLSHAINAYLPLSPSARFELRVKQLLSEEAFSAAFPNSESQATRTCLAHLLGLTNEAIDLNRTGMTYVEKAIEYGAEFPKESFEQMITNSCSIGDAERFM